MFFGLFAGKNSLFAGKNCVNTQNLTATPTVDDAGTEIAIFALAAGTHVGAKPYHPNPQP